MTAELARNLRAARLCDVRETARGAVGTLVLRPRGVARVVAMTEGDELRLQAQLLVAPPSDEGWRAAEVFLGAAVGQIKGVQATAGCVRAEGVAWLQIAGPPRDAPRLATVVAAVGAAALGRVNALLTDEALARAYLQMRGGGPSSPESPAREEVCHEHRAVEATGRD